MGDIHLTDVEEGLVPPDNPAAAAAAAAVAAQVAQLSNPATSSTRRRALLVGIAYHGELLNTHQDVDRYRDVLIGMFIGYLRNGGSSFIHIVILSALDKPRMDIGWKTSQCSRMTLRSKTASSRRARTSSVFFSSSSVFAAPSL